MNTLKFIFMMLLIRRAFSVFYRKPFQGITRVVFSGGGLKGLLYPGAYSALNEAGLLEGITHVSGSSVGSVAAGFLAVGMQNVQFRQAILNTHFKQLLGESAGRIFKKNVPGCLPLSKTGLPFEIWVRHHLIESVNQLLSSISMTQYPELRALKDKLARNKQAEFTFAELDLLNKKLPRLFKKLTVIATHYPDATGAVFDARCTPDVDIAKAIRASASLPTLLAPGSIGAKRFIDGGLFDNIPTEYFDVDKTGALIANQKKHQTLVFVFGEGPHRLHNPIFNALYGPRQDELNQGLRPVLFKPDSFERFQLDYLVCWLLGLQTKNKLTQKIEAGYQRIRQDYPLRTIVLNTGGLKTTDFVKAQKRSRVLWAFGYLDTLQFLLNHGLCQPDAFNDGHVVRLLVHYFVTIYRAILAGAYQDSAVDPLLKQIDAFLKQTDQKSFSWSKVTPYQQALDVIKEQTERTPDSVEAFALLLAVEYHHHDLNWEQLGTEAELTARNLMRYKNQSKSLYFFSQNVRHCEPLKHKIHDVLGGCMMKPVH